MRAAGRVAALAGAAILAAGGCSEGDAAAPGPAGPSSNASERVAVEQTAAPCPPLPSAAEASAAEIDRITDAAMREALAGKPVPPAQRSAARAKVVSACLQRSALGAKGGEAHAAEAALGACAAVIDRYLKAEGADAAMMGEVPPDRAAMTQIRAEFAQMAAGHVRAARVGNCRGG